MFICIITYEWLEYKLLLTIVFTIKKRWIYKLFNELLEMMCVRVELSVDVAVLYDAADTH